MISLRDRQLSFPKIISGHADGANQIGVVTMVPDRWTARRSGASLPNPKSVRVSLYEPAFWRREFRFDVWGKLPDIEMVK